MKFALLPTFLSLSQQVPVYFQLISRRPRSEASFVCFDPNNGEVPTKLLE